MTVVGLTEFLTGYFGFPLVLSLAAVIWRWRRSRPSGLMWGHLLLALVVGLVGALIGLAVFVMLVPVALMAYDRPPIGLAVYGDRVGAYSGREFLVHTNCGGVSMARAPSEGAG